MDHKILYSLCPIKGYLDVKLLFICHNRENHNGVNYNDGIFELRVYEIFQGKRRMDDFQ